MKDEVCRVMADIVGRGEVLFPWMESRRHAMAAAKHLREVADATDGVEFVSLVIQCAVSYIV